jgi:capsid protein
MSWLSALTSWLPRRSESQFAYDATIPSPKRKVPPGLLQSEDRELLAQHRRKLISSTRDIRRNFAIAAWMIRRHLDYVSTFSFQANTGNEALDNKLELLIKNRSRPENCDVTGRHPLPRIIRMAEASRVIDGDIGLLKIFDGRLQAIEGDRIRTPYGTPDGYFFPPANGNDKQATAWIQGIRIKRSGEPIEAAIFNRGLSANLFILDRYVPIRNIYIHTNLDRFDQVRGISPLAAAYNTLRDTYEGFDYALAKMKISQLFGLAIYREASEPFNNTAAFTSTESSDDTSEDDDEVSTSGYKVDFGKGPILLDLDPGDQAKFLESNSPSTEFQQFTQTTIAVALKALDIPYSFYSEDFTNYSGSRLAYLQYEQAAETKRDDVRRMLEYLTEWWFSIAIQDGELPGVKPEDIASGWAWIHRGMPWLDPLKEIESELLAIDAGLDNPEDVAIRHNRNFYENIDKIKRCREYAVKQGVELNAMQLTPTAGVTEVPEPAKPGQPQPEPTPPAKKVTKKASRNGQQATHQIAV